MIFKRKIYQRLLDWKQQRNGDTALLIEGARRIGKSTVAEDFARNEYKSYILIDFSIAPQEVHELFKDISDLDYLFLRLQLIYQVTLHERDSVIIFDEVQMAPLARQAIKHLVKDHRYDYIETGSLISVHRKSAEIVIPSEETKVEMFPMDYEEFRWALGDTSTVDLLRKMYHDKTPLGDALHRRMMREFRLYMLVGGMPQAVKEYLNSNNLQSVDAVKRDIIALYEEDFWKVDSSGRATEMYDAIPEQLSRNISRFPISSVIPGERIDRIDNIIIAMKESMTTNIAYHANDPNIGLSLNMNRDKFKMYTSDTGLFVTLAFKDKAFTDNVIYEKLLNDRLMANLGYIYENMVAQILRTSGKQLFYHTMPIDDGKKYYEVDFLIPEQHKISPIEVKSSSKYRKHTSIDEFCAKYSSRIHNKYIVHTRDYKVENGAIYLPIYMAMFL